MKKYIYIGLLGAAGAIARYAVKSIDMSALFQHFPAGTLAINLAGSFIFSLVVTLAYETGRLDQDIRLGITAGFLGAFTTFSAFCRDAVVAVQSGFYAVAAVYAVLSVLLGLALSFAGVAAAKAVVGRMTRRLSDSTGGGAD